MLRDERSRAFSEDAWRRIVAASPGPVIPEPERRQERERRFFGTVVRGGDPDQYVVRRALRVLDENVEVAILVEDVRVGELVLGIDSCSTPVLDDEVEIRVLALRILVQRLHVRVRGGAVEIVVALLHVLAVVPLVAVEAEEPLLENRIAAVPERERETEPALTIGDAQQPVLAPPVGSASRHVMGEAFPHVTARRVVLPHRAPLPLGQVRPPPLPIQLASGVFLEADRFGGRHGSNRYFTRGSLGSR